MHEAKAGSLKRGRPEAERGHDVTLRSDREEAATSPQIPQTLGGGGMIKG